MKRGRKSDGPTTVRTTGRIKKAKVVFDPSDNNLPKHLRNSAGSVQGSQQQQSVSSDHASDTSNERKIKEEKRPHIDFMNAYDETCCYVCGRRELKKNKNKLISCKDCEHKAHISCLKLEFEDHVKLRENYRCDVCQICSSCYEGPEDGELITCTKCVKSFHFACHIPSMARFPTQTKWLCSKCTIPKPKSLLKVVGVPAAQPPTSSPPLSSDVEKKSPVIPLEELANHNNHKKEIIEKEMVVKKQPSPSRNNNLHLSSNASSILQPSSNSLLTTTESNSPDMSVSDIPIVKNWSASEVTEYFTKFFPNEADIFKDQDIDGQSLLLLKRSDVVNRLAIKLGPALRIYNLVLKIQSVSTDPTIGW